MDAVTPQAAFDAPVNPHVAAAAVTPVSETPETRRMRAYVLWSVVPVAAVLAALVAFVLAVDVFGAFGSRMLPPSMVPENRRLGMGGDRMIKGLELLRLQPQLVIVGSSRVLGGFDPTSPVLAPLGAYNLGLAGAGPVQTLPAARFAATQVPSVRRVVLAMEYDTFFHSNGFIGDFARSVFAGRSAAEGYAELLFSVQAIRLSAEAFRDALKGHNNMTLSRGGLGMVASIPPGGAYAHYTKEVEAGVFLLRQPSLTADPAALARRYDEIRDTLRDIKARGSEVDLILSPLHVWRLELIRRAGLWPIYEDWKRRLTEIVAQVEAGPGSGRVRLIDFNVVDPRTAEVIPPPGEEPAPRLFGETSHFRPPLGDVVIQIVTGSAEPDAETGFGTVLTPDNLDSHLKRTGARFEAWHEANPRDQRLVQEAMDRMP